MSPPWPPSSVGELIEFLGPGLVADESCPLWPPDTFAVCASLLRRTGAYVPSLDRGRQGILGANWVDTARRIGRDWRTSIEQHLQAQPRLLATAEVKDPNVHRAPSWPGLVLPDELRGWWAEIRSLAGKSLGDVAADLDQGLCRPLLKLCLVADEASAGIGIGKLTSSFLRLAASRLLFTQFRSLGWAVLPEKAVVLPKQHTPQVGLTLRSLTHHLALCPAGEVTPTWRMPFSLSQGERLDLMNLLLLPWPLDLSPMEFELIADERKLVHLAESHRYFTFHRRPDAPSFEPFLSAAIETARGIVGRVHAVILPELALTHQEYCQAEKVAVREHALLIAGVGCKDGDFGLQEEVNLSAVQPAGLTFPNFTLSPELVAGQRMLQRKHHRWCLDPQQIIQYRLGGRMPASKRCWELFEVMRREVRFFTITDWLTVSVLICEDLARQEPAAEILRAVGPNLVVALLMDGPQLRNRWPSHYAGVLADDPGCSVLTLTSLGMSRMSQPRAAEVDRSRTIALWRDARTGDHEIELPANHDACILSLACESHEEFTADGRGDHGETHYPVFGGVRSFAVPRPAASGPGEPA